ncbi:hypothetical protein ACH4D3_17410 [Streptomyces sp. NPDC018026]|uniref:hypothetical protein n=1 Tax=Streptomyces sp. NPDC018026 TaxID=3365031 RepID=UPI00379100DE
MDASKEAARGLSDIETFLYRDAHLRAARRRVAEFTSRAPGLTEEQKSGIEQWYLDEQVHVAHMVTDHIADSISTLEEQHRGRFGRWLRGTMIGMALITAAMGLAVAVILGTWG